MDLLSTVTRFMNKVAVNDSGCWEWQASLNHRGYGKFWINGSTIQAHRAGYEILVSQIPKGLELHHVCENRRCVRPTHLQPMTGAENRRIAGCIEAMTAERLSRTHCKYGHIYSEENTYVDSRGGRDCKICRSRRRREYEERKLNG